jgi:hypothetical protein
VNDKTGLPGLNATLHGRSMQKVLINQLHLALIQKMDTAGYPNTPVGCLPISSTILSDPMKEKNYVTIKKTDRLTLMKM